MKKLRYFVYGSATNYYDIRYVFDDLELEHYTMDYDVAKEYISAGLRGILCCDNKNGIQAELIKRFGDGCCITDDELITSLNYPLWKKAAGKKVYIWGTGGVCNQFLQWLKDAEGRLYGDKTIEITGFIDNDLCKQGTEIEGRRVFSPKILDTNCFVIIAVKNISFVEIEKQIQDIGLVDDNYVSANTVMDDVSAYFKQVYEAGTFYSVVCKNNDENIRIAQNGNVCSCCLAYKSVYGNILIQTFEDIWSSNRARISRLSLAKQAFVFCDKNRCPYLAGLCESGNRKPEYTEYTHENGLPYSIAPEIDASCNLQCTTCRKDVYVDNSNEREIFTDVILDKIAPLPTRFVLNTVGEPFSSKNCIRLLQNPVLRQKMAIGIYTNGTLLTPMRFEQLLKEYESVDIAVSVDAATKDTYEKIRIGGNYEQLIDNLSYISRLKKNNKIKYFRLNFTVQSANVHEMQEFVSMAARMGVDRVVFNAIENWGIYSAQQFEELSVRKNGMIRNEYMKYFTRDLIENPLVDFFNFSSVLRIEPKKMDYMH